MSSYLVLARKYRPRTFDELAGQDVVARVLSNALDEGRVGHAYLFTGPRGTGKTTTARILAKCLNCETGPTSKPCGTCQACTSIDAGSASDVTEIDAASHTQVDNIRDLRDEVAYAPMHLRRKVYIVDEVHMLSKASFNALLKTLEEPPPHVVFLFATTELHKVLDTIQSRCQVLRLDPLAAETIATRLDEVFAAEGVTPEAGVTAELARAARGGMRDALSLADELLALSGDAPTLADLRRLGGPRGTRELDALLGHVEAGERAEVLAAIGAAAGEETALVDGLLTLVRGALVARLCGDDSPLLPDDEAERALVTARSRTLEPERAELALQELLRVRERLRSFPGHERLVVEVTLLDLCRRESTLPFGELLARLSSLEERLGGAPSAAPAPPPVTAAPAAPAPAPAPAPAASTAPASARADDPWPRALATLAARHGSLASLLRAHGRLSIDGRTARVTLSPLDADGERLVDDRRNRAALTRALADAAGRELELELATADGTPAPAPAQPRTPRPEAPPPAPAPAPAPAAPPPAARPADSDAAPAGGDAFVREVADLFDGVIEERR